MYLIDKEYLSRNTRIKSTVSDDVLVPYFQDVQDIHVTDLLGIPLLETYLNHVNNDAELTPVKQALLPDIQKYYAKRIEYEYTLLANVSLTNKGATTDHKGDLEAIEKVRGVIAAQFAHYENRIIQYLSKYKSEFTDYFPTTDEPSPSTAHLGFSFKPLPKKKYY